MKYFFPSSTLIIIPNYYTKKNKVNNKKVNNKKFVKEKSMKINIINKEV